MKKFIIILICILSLFTSCEEGEQSVDSKVKQQQDLQQKDLNNKIGLPDIKNWSEKSNMKYIYELRDKTDLICYLYTRSEVTGKYIYEGECMGYGIPYSTQYSNPEKAVDLEDETGEYHTGYYELSTMPQAEPNGLFMPTSSSATWIIRLSNNGEPQVEYYEPSIVVSPSKKSRNLCEEWSLPDDY